MVNFRGRLELMDLYLVKSIRSYLIYRCVFHLHFPLLLIESSFCFFTKWVDLLSLSLDSGIPEFWIFQIALCLENESVFLSHVNLVQVTLSEWKISYSTKWIFFFFISWYPGSKPSFMFPLLYHDLYKLLTRASKYH